MKFLGKTFANSIEFREVDVYGCEECGSRWTCEEGETKECFKCRKEIRDFHIEEGKMGLI